MLNIPSPGLAPDGGEDEAPAGEFVQLNRPLLLAELRQLATSATIEALRRAVQLLRQRLADQHDPLCLPAPEGESVTFAAVHLLDDLDQIAGARTLERAQYYVERLLRGLLEERTSPINDINLNRWKTYDDILTDSLWLIDRRDNSGAHTADYWGNYIPQIPYQMMRRYTRAGEWVLDPFAGLGTTLIEGQRLGRNTIGVELQAAVIARAQERVAGEPNRHGVVSALTLGDSATTDFQALLRCQGRESAQLALVHPPYFDIIKFSDDPRDLSNAPSVEDFLELLGQVVANVALALDRGRYLVLVIGDKYARGDWIPLGFLAMNAVQQRGFTLKSIVVKNFEETTGKRQQKELWRYRALVGGFYIFKHEYIFVFKKS